MKRLAFCLAGGMCAWMIAWVEAANPIAMSAGCEPVGAGRTGFTVMANEEMGIGWTNYIPIHEYIRRQNLMNGAGVALGDYDGDGRCDIYLCNRFGANALYRNLGEWRFEETTWEAGVACTNQVSTGAVFADVNGDGELDLLVSSFSGPNALFLNLGGGRFTNITERAGVGSYGGTTSMALSDLDGDGDLDLYVCYLGVEAIFRDGVKFSTRMVRGKPVVTGRLAKRLQIIDGKLYELGDLDRVYRNNGKGIFEKLEWEKTFFDAEGGPAPEPYDMGLAVQIRDINEDGRPDIYTCNDFKTPDQLWFNEGDWRFKAVDPLALRNMSYASMGVDFADMDRDGHFDFVTVEMLSRDHRRRMRQSSAMELTMRGIGEYEGREDVRRNALYWNRGDGTYAEIANFSGVADSDWSWTPIFLDADLDGYEDLFISNGHLRDVNDRDFNRIYPPESQRTLKIMEESLGQFPELTAPNNAYRNLGNLRFADRTEEWGFGVLDTTHGMALADLDNDGDQDIVGNRSNAGPLIYRNDSPAPRVFVRLRGNAPNTQGIGAKVTLHGGPFPQTQEIISGGRYVSGDDPGRTFAAPAGSGELSLEVRWRSGVRTVVNGIQANTRYEIAEIGEEVRAQASPSGPKPLFEDLSAELNHRHHETAFEDFLRQPLLPKKLTQLGPGVAWFDLDGDGLEELVVGAGKGGQIAVFENAKGKLGPAKLRGPMLADDSSAIVGFAGKGGSGVLVGMAQYEHPQKSAAPFLKISASGELDGEQAAPVAESTGPMAMADVEGDGDLDLFVGGRFIPGQYPAAATSMLFRDEGGKLVKDEKNSGLLEKIGLVSSALFTDLDNDGFAELVVACEWGPIRVFKNEGGQLSEATSRLGLDGLLGIWTSITSGDFNGDGLMDLVAGNWGLNSYHQRSPKGPWYLFYGDLNRDGRLVILEAAHDAQMNAIVPFRDMEFLKTAMPWLPSRFPTHAQFAESSVEQILGEFLPQMRQVRASTLTSHILWNRGGRLEPEPLPDQAQWTPIMGLNVADFNGDGHEDVFVGQNYFAVRPDDDRLDAGRGLLLAGSSSGRLTPVPGQESGLLIYGEQRGSAVADFDGDGRTDLVVTQNGAATRLFRNQSGAAGLRVRLAGPEGNPRGYGAVLRVVHGEKRGPAREIHAGSGYWSQDGAIQVLHGIEQGAELAVRWPGGKETRVKIPPEAREVSIGFDGTVKTIR